MRLSQQIAGGIQVQFEVTVEKDEGLRRLDEMRERARNLSPFWGKTGAILRERMERNFRDAGPPGYRWAALKPPSVHGKHAFLTQAKAARVRPFNKQGQPPPRLAQLGQQLHSRSILMRTGRLRDSWVLKHAAGHIERVEAGNAFVFGSRLHTQEVGLTMRKIVQSMTAQSALKPMHTITKSQLQRHQKGVAQRIRAPLAAIHELGAPRKHIPARPQFGMRTLDPGDRKRIIEALQDYLVTGHAGA